MIAVRLALLLVGGYVLVCALLFVFQRRLIYPAPAAALQPEFGELVEIEGAAGGPVVGAWCAPPDDSALVVVHFHGNAEQLAWQADLAGGFTRAGLGFLALEFPGYGLMAEQSSSEGALVAAAEAGIAWLRARGIGPERTVVMGRSLGTGPATRLAHEGHAARMLLISPYTSLVDMAHEVLPFVPARWLLRDRFDNAALAPAVDVPVLLVHGERDEVIPARMSRELATLFPHATLRIVSGYGHNDLPVTTELMHELASFCVAP